MNPAWSRLRIALFLLAVSIPAVMSSPAWSGDAAADRRELQRIKRELQNRKKDLKQAVRRERSILSELDKIDREVQKDNAELRASQKHLAESEAALKSVEQGSLDIARRTESLRTAYAQRLRSLYKMSRGGYAAVVLSANGPGQALKRVKYLGMVAGQDRAMMQEYRETLERLTVRQQEIAGRRKEILERSQIVARAKSSLEDRKRRKAALLADVRERKSLQEQTLRELEEASAGLWAMIKRDERERKATRQTTPQQASGTRSGQRLPWPLEGPVLTHFGMQRHPQFGTMVFRRGIEIQGREGEAVKAVRDGRIVYADWYKGFGQLVIIDHGNGLYTLYGNLQQLDLQKDAPVARGQTIGRAGDTGTAKGSRLYFEIRRDGEAQDPLAWLAKR